MNGDFFFHPSWPVFYRDNHLLVLYKPAGLLVQADETREVSLLDLGKLWLKQVYEKPGRVFLAMVHRLDRPVAGVVLFCRTSKSAARISEQFRMGTAEKYYLAVLEGELKKKSGRLVHFIERRENLSSRVVSGKIPGARRRACRLPRWISRKAAPLFGLSSRLDGGTRYAFSSLTSVIPLPGTCATEHRTRFRISK